MEQKVLLEALAGELPEGTIRFNSRVTGFKRETCTTGVTQVELEDGSVYSAKVITPSLSYKQIPVTSAQITHDLHKSFAMQILGSI